jgi:subtilase family serine protease
MPAARLAVPARLTAALVSLLLLLVLVGQAHAATSVQNACASAPAGQARCEAQILVSGSQGKPVHPNVQSVTTGTHARVLSHAAMATAAGEPQAGTPLYLQQAYDLTSLSATQGASDTVAVADAYNDPNVAADLATFRAHFGLPACTVTSGCFRVLNEGGTPAPLPASSTSWSVEQSLDVDAVSALCPNCKIVLVEAVSPDNADMQAAIEAAVSAGATIVSNSWSVDAATSPFTNSLSFPGVSVLAAAGDDGTASAGESAFPAALPTVTAVGGTSLNPSEATPRGFSETAWDDSGSGCDSNEPAPAWQPQTGCAGRAYNDISADGDPSTGLDIYDSEDGGWLQVGGSSLATPLAAAYEAVTAVNGATPQWAYTDESLLNAVGSGSNGACAVALICNAADGWNGPGGAGSISGDVLPGAPGIAGPDVAGGTTYTERVSAGGAALQGGVYANGQATTYYWQYGKTSAYGSQTAAAAVPTGTAAVSVTGALASLAPATTYHYRLVATNASGTSYGYDFTLTTAPAKTASSTQANPTKAKPAKAKPAKAKSGTVARGKGKSTRHRKRPRRRQR